MASGGTRMSNGMTEQVNTSFSQDTRRRLVVCGLVFACVALACSIGVLTPADPIFTPPSGVLEYEPTVFTDVSLVQPTPMPESETSITISEPIIQAPAAEPTTQPSSSAPLLYYTQAGDTLPVVAIRFGVQPEEISSPETLSGTGLLSPNQLLIIPHRLANTTSSEKIMADSEFVFSPSAAYFDVEAFVNQAGGYLSAYREWLGSTEWTSGAEIILRVALENSINPRLLLSLLEYQSGWVYGQPANLLYEDYPFGQVDLRRKGLYAQLVWAVNQLTVGYYGWREGYLTDIRFSDGATARLAPDLNAGSAGLQYYFSQLTESAGWVTAVDAQQGLPALHMRMFGSPWIRALDYEPLYPPDLTQPGLILPFLIGQLWSFTGGPHGAWERDGAWAALDFAPASTQPGCVDSNAGALAAAPGLVVRTGNGVVVLDLDGDGFEQTGWVLLYLHVSEQVIEVGDWVEMGDMLGHPSCEGGIATGTHIHLARKYNGEWIAADGPLAFNLSGWVAHSNGKPYQGSLTRNGTTISASVFGSFESRILREREEP
jgi:murein DD-endopeptidase MepM/ murein hydrolase activator NlpD